MRSMILILMLFMTAGFVFSSSMDDDLLKENRELRAENNLLRSTVDRLQKKINNLEKQISKNTEPVTEKKDESKVEEEKSESSVETPQKVISKCPDCDGSGYVKCTHEDKDGKKHSNWYEPCKYCDGKGKIGRRSTKKVPCLLPDGKKGTRTIHYTKYVRCHRRCTPIVTKMGKKIYASWVCPHCGNGRYPGYVKCPKCDGTGKMKRLQQQRKEMTNERVRYLSTPTGR